MSRITYLLLVFILVSCNTKQKKLAELNIQANEYLMNEDLENAKKVLFQAIEIDKSNPYIKYRLIGVYAHQDSIDKAFEVLKEISTEQKNADFYHLKASMHELKGQKKEAFTLYNKALDVTDTIDVKNNNDISALISYARLETLAGKKEQAVAKLNKALKLDWLSYNHRDLLEFFRNEFEYYQGNGNSELDDPKNDITIKTTNPDSLKIVLKENHINISGSSSGRKDTTEIYFSEKYRN